MGGDIYGETQSLQSQRAPASIKHAHDESSCSRHLLKRKENPKRDKTTPGKRERGGLAMGTPVFWGGCSHQGASSALRRHHDRDGTCSCQAGGGQRPQGGGWILASLGDPVSGGGWEVGGPPPSPGRGSPVAAGGGEDGGGVGGGSGSVGLPGAGDGGQGAGFGHGV